MVEVRKYTVRPYKPARADRKDSLRVYLSATALHYHGLRAGELCQLSTTAQSSYPAIVWPSSEKLQDTVIQTTKSLQTLYSLRLGDQISVSRSLDLIRDAHEIVLSEHQDSENKSSLPSLGQEDRVHWAWILEYDLKQAAHVCPGMIFADVRARGEGRTFQIIAINGSSNKYLYHSSTLRSVVVSADPGHSPWRLENHEVRLLGLDAALVGGLSIQLSELNCAIAAYGTAAGNDKLKPSHLPRRGGILLHGPSGTGKSMLLRIVAQAGWRQVFRLQDTIAGYPIGDTDKAIHNIFSEARRLEPSVVIIDDLEAVARKRDPVRVSEPLSIAGSLCKAFDQRVGDRVLVIAATKKLALVDESLRRPGRFQTEVEIPVPGADARAEILHIAYSLPKTAHDHQLLHLAKRTHGYVGSDLVELIQSAMDKAVLRIRALNADKEDSGFAKGITEEDIEAALLKIRPTAMKEIFLDTPKVQWSQIGGQAEVKEALQEAVEWPLKHRSDMERLGSSPKKGLLLYGPPGCSKTLVAKAVATEGNLNFIAVKGAEILSMYVGESERAVREIFEKARGASPSIIFFDEIDAIGATREHSQQAGLHVLTTLLNELDGIEALKGVFILAATNRPEVLDPALLRPGRLDSALYVGLPDYDTRLEIFAITTCTTDLGGDVDVSGLAHLTGGYSGAEIVSICQQAGDAALREQLRCRQQQRVSMKHFETALAKVPRQVTPEMIERYEAWRKVRQR